MREIKFRVWDKDNKVMIFDFQDQIGIDLYGSIIRFYSVNDGDGYIDEMEEDISGRYHLQRYTGLKDKNGKDIYEGDYISVVGKYDPTEEIIDEVGYGEFEFEIPPFEMKAIGFYIQTKKMSKGDLLPGRYQDKMPFNSDIECTVIGNIYENPELLEEKSERD